MQFASIALVAAAFTASVSAANYPCPAHNLGDIVVKNAAADAKYDWTLAKANPCPDAQMIITGNMRTASNFYLGAFEGNDGNGLRYEAMIGVKSNTATLTRKNVVVRPPLIDVPPPNVPANPTYITSAIGIEYSGTSLSLIYNGATIKTMTDTAAPLNVKWINATPFLGEGSLTGITVKCASEVCPTTTPVTTTTETSTTYPITDECPIVSTVHVTLTAIE